MSGNGNYDDDPGGLPSQYRNTDFGDEGKER